MPQKGVACLLSVIWGPESRARRYGAWVRSKTVRTEEQDIELGEIEGRGRVAVRCPVGVVCGGNRCGLGREDRLHFQRRLARERGWKCVFRVEVACRSLRSRRGQELDEELVRAELGRSYEPGEIGGQAGLALGNECVVKPCGRNEGRCEDPLGREGARVVESVVQCDELHGKEVN